MYEQGFFFFFSGVDSSCQNPPLGAHFPSQERKKGESPAASAICIPPATQGEEEKGTRDKKKEARRGRKRRPTYHRKKRDFFPFWPLQEKKEVLKETSKKNERRQRRRERVFPFLLPLVSIGQTFDLLDEEIEQEKGRGLLTSDWP